MTPLCAGLASLDALWTHWRDTAAGRWVALHDDEDALGDVRRLLRQFEPLGDVLTMAAWFEADQARATVEALGAAPAEDLRGSALVRLLPAHAPFVHADNTLSLGQALSAQLTEAEGRASQDELSAEMNEAEEKLESVERFHRAIYGHFARLREVIHEDGPAAFKRGVASVATTDGRLRRLQIEVGEDDRMTLKDAPLPMMALVGRGRDRAAAEAYVRSLHEALVEGVRLMVAEEAGVAIPADAVRAEVRPADLGLGQPTLTFSDAWIGQISEAAGHGLSITIEGDWHPHVFFVGEDLVVLSTSPRLSEQILASLSDPSGAFPLPAVRGDGARLVGFGHMSGQGIGRLVDQLAIWMAGLEGVEAGEPFNFRDEPEFNRMMSFLGIVADGVRLIDAVHWTTLDDDRRHLTEAAADFVRQ